MVNDFHEMQDIMLKQYEELDKEVRWYREQRDIENYLKHLQALKEIYIAVGMWDADRED